MELKIASLTRDRDELIFILKMQKNSKIKMIDPLKDRRWDNFIKNNEYSTVYHHSVWKELLYKTFNHMEAKYFVLEDNSNNIIAGIPLYHVKSWMTGDRLVSVPFASVCRPLVSKPEDFEKLIEFIIEKVNEYKCSYLEMRIRDDQPMLIMNGLKGICQFKSHVLKLDKDLDSLRKSFHKTSIQQRIKRAEREGLTERLASSENDMKAFYCLFTKQRLKKFGLPPHPYRLFKNMWEILRPKDMLNLHIIEYENRVIAGMLVLKFNRIAISEHSASDSRYIKSGPNQLLWWKAIETSHMEGFEFFDLGKSSIKEKGLIEFKSRWQPQEYNLYQFYFPDVKGVYSSQHESLKYKLMNIMWRHTPLPIAKMGGDFLYNHMG